MTFHNDTELQMRRVEDPTAFTGIALIGPMGSGKSTIAPLIAERLGWPSLDLDEKRWDYYDEIGFDKDKEKSAWQEGGFRGVYEYWKPYEVHAVERVASDYSHNVIAFGAGHSVYDNEKFAERAKMALQDWAVIHLLPCEDLQKAHRVLLERQPAEAQNNVAGFDGERDFHQYILEHPGNAELATSTFYTDGKTTQQTLSEIWDWLVAHGMRSEGPVSDLL